MTTVTRILETSLLDRPTRRMLEQLVADSGVSGEPNRAYLAARMCFILDKGAPISAPPALLYQGLDRWVCRRAWDLLEAHRDRLPPLRDDRKPAP